VTGPVGSPYRDLARGELENFRKLDGIRNHWAREPIPSTYYWYLQFTDCHSLHGLVQSCHGIRSLEYYDPVPLRSLHLTVERVGYSRDCSPRLLRDVTQAARQACRDVEQFTLTIGALGGTTTAVGFRAVPDERTVRLRDVLQEATMTVYPGAPVRNSPLIPHISIAYCNSNAPATRAIAAVEGLSQIAPAVVRVREIVLVLLERGPRSYSWHPVAHIPLAEPASK
jgi:hypothetical protein